MSAAEARGLRFAFWGLIGVLVFVALLVAPPGAPAAESGDRRDHRRLAVHEQPDRRDRRCCSSRSAPPTASARER